MSSTSILVQLHRRVEWKSTILPTILMGLCIVAMAYSQVSRLEFERYSVEQGLSHNSVNSMLQDTRGFLWVGTRNGLNRFDGYEFTVFKDDPLDSSSLSDDYIFTLQEDHEGNIWAATWTGGVNKLERTSGRFVRYQHDSNNPASMSTNWIQTLYCDREGTIWVGTLGGGLNRYDPQSKSFIHYKHDSLESKSISGDYVSCIFEDSRGALWVGVWHGGLNRFDRTSGRFVHYRHRRDNPKSLSSDEVSSIGEDRDGVLWIGTQGGGLNRFNRDREEFTRLSHDPRDPNSLSGNNTSVIFRDRSGTMWFGNDISGLDKLVTVGKQQRFIHFVHNPSNPASLSSSDIRAITQDKTGNLWIGTGSGLNKVRRAEIDLQSYTGLLRPEGEIIVSMCEDQSRRVWCGSNAGNVYLVDTVDMQMRLSRRLPFGSAGEQRADCSALLVGRDGTLWVATHGAGIYSFKTGSILPVNFRYPGHASSPPLENIVHSISETNDGNLFLGTEAGAVTFDVRKKQFASVFPGYATTIQKAKQGGWWLKTLNNGLILIDESWKILHEFRHDLSNPRSLSSNRVVWVCEDQAGSVWVGTHGGGLNSLIRGSDEFTHFSLKEGLCDDVIYGILEESDGRLWLSTEKGLCRFDPRTRTCRTFTINDGLPSNQFEWNGFLKRSDAQFFYSTANGVISFNPRRATRAAVVPPVVLTSFTALHKPVSFDRQISDVQHIVITFRENVFSFQFAVLDLTDPDRNEYAYILEGFDKEWTSAGTRRFIAYTNLDPGTYRLRVKGSGSDGVWNDAGAVIQLTITPPFWLTWWFIGLVAAGLVATMLSLYNWRIRKLLEVERTRDTIARDLHDDIASTLGSVALYSESLKGKLKNPPPGTKELIDRISALSLDAVDSMSDIIWSTSPRNDSLNDLLIHVRDLTSQICTANKIEYSTKIVPLDPDVKLEPVVRKNIYLVFKESINNVVKHARATQVTVTAEIHGRIFEMTIWDDGKGFDVERSGFGVKDSGLRKKMARGHGLRSLEKRAKEIKAVLTITSAPGQGTTVKLIQRMT